MGNYLQTTGASLSKNPEARNLVNQLRGKLTLEKLCTAFNIYMQEIYPKENLTWDEYDIVFASLLNNT